jgi:hypothetical protein
MKLWHMARSAGAHVMIRRLVRAWPIVGGVAAVLMVAGTVRRKGLVRGSLDTALDAMPFVGAVKNLLEVRRGRDFIPVRQRYRPGRS